MHTSKVNHKKKKLVYNVYIILMWFILEWIHHSYYTIISTTNGMGCTQIDEEHQCELCISWSLFKTALSNS